MGGSQKSKRVTWASDVNLCQVRLFLSEECPSQVGTGTQEHLQAKALWAGQSDDNLPPGFEGIQPANPLTFKLSQIPLMKWKVPPRFVVDSTWQIVSGEESRETEAQNQREMRVLEAIYPRPSAIPPNPSALLPIEDSTNNNQFTPIVPITAIEDEDGAIDTSSHGSNAPNTNPTIPQSHSMDSHVEPNIVAAAQVALSSVMSNNSQGNLIDSELLMKILGNPKMIEQLLANHSVSPQNIPSSSTHSIPPPSIIPPPPPSSSSSFQGAHNNPPSSSSSFQGAHNNPPSTSTPYNNVPINRRDPVSSHITRGMGNGPFYPPPTRIGSMPNLRPPPVPDVASAPSSAPITKDINYYKSLIQQHGGERREVMAPQFSHQSNQMLQDMKQRETNKPKIMKPCIYFNSSRGCRNGANCTYQHDLSTQQRAGSIPEVQSSKRVKLDREITGT